MVARVWGKAMQHMHSVRGPATVIFTALLIIILASASRTTYTLAPAKRPEGAAVASCAPSPEPVREAAERRACPWPHAMRRAGRSPKHADADAAAPDATPLPPAGDAWTAQAPNEAPE